MGTLEMFGENSLGESGTVREVGIFRLRMPIRFALRPATLKMTGIVQMRDSREPALSDVEEAAVPT